MENGIGGENYTLHFVCPTSRMHFTYHLYSKGETHILPAFQHVVNYIERRYGLKVRILHGDGETAVQFGKQFDAWVVQMGFLIESSPPYTQAQNGMAERSGGVIIARGRNMRNTANLPALLWPEIYTCAAYLLNRSPTRSLGWITPIGFIEKYLGNPVPKPSLHHLVPYGCRAYSFIKNQPKLNRLEPRAHIGYLVGYDSTNVFRIWIPSQKTVISTRDVIFDIIKRYNPENDQSAATPEVIETIQTISLEVDDLIDNWELLPPLKTFETTVDKPGDTIIVNTGLQTPRTTPEVEVLDANTTANPTAIATTINESYPQNDYSNQSGAVEQSSAGPPANSEPTRLGPFTPLQSNTPGLSHVSTNQEVQNTIQNTIQPAKPPFAPPEKESKVAINKGASASNIIEGKRTRNKPAAFHFERIYWDMNNQYFSQYNSAFTAGTNFKIPRIHLKDLPKPPKTMKEVRAHPYGHYFLQAANIEYKGLWDKGTFESTPMNDISLFILPLIWVFTYKVDEDGYLVKFKARLVVRGDLQVAQTKDTYAATLAARVFRALMAIAAYFDLDIHQFDAINAFCNAELDDLVYVRYPDGFQVPGSCLKLIRALYGLPRSPLLWYNLIHSKLKNLGLYPVPDCPCLFTNDKLVVFFYVDDIAVLSLPSNRSAYEQFRTELLREFNMHELGELKWFLGIRVIRDRSIRKLWLCQDAYITKLCDRYRRSDTPSRRPRTPMSTEPLLPYDGTTTQEDIERYSSLVGSLTYSSTITRADTAFCTRTLCQHLRNPGPEHFAAAYRCRDYLEDTRFYALEYGGDVKSTPVFSAASDAAFADDVPTRRSSEGSALQLFNGLFDWQAKLQATVSTSTTEAETLAVAHLSAWILWWGRFFYNIDLDIDQSLTVHCDNLQTIGLLIKDTPKLVTKLKHVDIQ
jgi:hypothetical protein